MSNWVIILISGGVIIRMGKNKTGRLKSHLACAYSGSDCSSQAPRRSFLRLWGRFAPPQPQKRPARSRQLPGPYSSGRKERSHSRKKDLRGAVSYQRRQRLSGFCQALEQGRVYEKGVGKPALLALSFGSCRQLFHTPNRTLALDKE